MAPVKPMQPRSSSSPKPKTSKGPSAPKKVPKRASGDGNEVTKQARVPREPSKLLHRCADEHTTWSRLHVLPKFAFDRTNTTTHGGGLKCNGVHGAGTPAMPPHCMTRRYTRCQSERCEAAVDEEIRRGIPVVKKRNGNGCDGRYRIDTCKRTSESAIYAQFQHKHDPTDDSVPRSPPKAKVYKAHKEAIREMLNHNHSAKPEAVLVELNEQTANGKFQDLPYLTAGQVRYAVQQVKKDILHHIEDKEELDWCLEERYVSSESDLEDGPPTKGFLFGHDSATLDENAYDQGTEDDPFPISSETLIARYNKLVEAKTLVRDALDYANTAANENRQLKQALGKVQMKNAQLEAKYAQLQAKNAQLETELETSQEMQAKVTRRLQEVVHACQLGDDVMDLDTSMCFI